MSNNLIRAEENGLIGEKDDTVPVDFINYTN